jgi:hypothetical protein
MDQYLEKAFDVANFMVTLANQKRVLKEEFKQHLIYFYNGSTFSVDKELITFVKSIIDLGQTDHVLIDDNDLPVHVENLSDFLDNILSIFSSASNEYYSKYQKLKNNRSVESLLDL